MWRVSFIHPCTIYRFFMHSILFLRWFFGTINRREAEEYLMAHTNARGTFLVRESEQNPGGFALSIKDWDQERSYHVKHYKIKPLDNNRSAPADNLQTSKTLFSNGFWNAVCTFCRYSQERRTNSNLVHYYFWAQDANSITVHTLSFPIMLSGRE